MKNKSAFSAHTIAMVGLMTALVFLFSWLEIPLGASRIHLGNAFCALAGLLFGPAVGGIASGFGSMLFDLTDPVYVAECWITLITKFFIGFLAGLIAGRGTQHSLRRDIAGASVGSAAYIVLYLTKSYLIMIIEGQAAGAIATRMMTKTAASLTNAAIAVVVSVLLAKGLRPALIRAGILKAPAKS